MSRISASVHSLLDIIKKTTEFFAGKGLENARFNAEHLIGHALGLKRMQLYVQFERLLTEADLERIRPLVKRRAQREPLAYVLGWTEFCDLRLRCDRRALIPRPETEELVEYIGNWAKSEGRVPGSILDLGTGTGCIALALAKLFPEAKVCALDASEEALTLARENAKDTGLEGRVEFLRSNWFSAIPAEARFDLIVSNPPYLTDLEHQECEPEVRLFEPLSALVAPDEGIADLNAILVEARGRLNPGGLLALETGIAQHAVLLQRLQAAGYQDARSLKDLSGRERFVCARG